MPPNAVADSIAIPSGGNDVAQPPPGADWSIRRVFAPNNVETKITDGNDTHAIRKGEIADNIPITTNIHIQFDSSACVTRKVFYHAVDL